MPPSTDRRATASVPSGPCAPGVELRVADDGEVLIKSDTVFGGYFKDEEATREILSDNGWLRSGDVGHIDDDGFLTITDRLKDILVTAGGKNVAPQNLENALKTHAVISQALVLGDRRPYIAALITLSEDVDPTTAEPAVQHAVDEVNSELSRFEQIKRFTILPRLHPRGRRGDTDDEAKRRVSRSTCRRDQALYS